MSTHHTLLLLATSCFRFLIKGLTSNTCQNERFSDRTTHDGLCSVEVPFVCMTDPTQVHPLGDYPSTVMLISVRNTNPIHGILFSQAKGIHISSGMKAAQFLSNQLRCRQLIREASGVNRYTRAWRKGGGGGGDYLYTSGIQNISRSSLTHSFI